MALKIRMARGGSKKKPVYRIVVADTRSPRDGKFVEKLGTHNPFLDKQNPGRFAINEDRVKYWLSVGAKTSDRLNRCLSKMGLETARTIFEQTKKSLPKKKAQERLAAEQEKKRLAEESLKKDGAPIDGAEKNEVSVSQEENISLEEGQISDSSQAIAE